MKSEKNFTLIVLIILCLNLPAAAQGSADKSGDISAFQQLKFDGKYILEAPWRMKAKEYVALGAVAGLAGIIYADKKDINKEFQRHRTKTRDNLSDVIRPFGDIRVLAGTTAALYSWGFLAERPREKETGMMLGESLAYTAVLTGIGQFVFAEERPYDGGRMYFFRLDGHGVSGHAAFCASMAGPLNRQYLQIEAGDTEGERLAKYTGKLAIYGMPVLVGLSRINDNQHYAWNALLGGAVGYTIGELVANAHHQSKHANIAVAPFIEDESEGIAVSLKL